ncbi:hypothetical protein JYT19_01190, partial [Sulfobacillus acidophilus]|nr:hypothetical protein [Sulfobacillus acidophilus]
MPQEGSNQSSPFKGTEASASGDVAQSSNPDKGEHIATTNIDPGLRQGDKNGDTTTQMDPGLRQGDGEKNRQGDAGVSPPPTTATIENQIARGYAIWYG